MTRRVEPYREFDRSRLRLEPLSRRQHDLDLSSVMPLSARGEVSDPGAIDEIARAIVAARDRKAAVILMMGAHVLRDGNVRFLIDLMERGLVTHVGTNGAAPIHDWEMALVGATTESVARYIQEGQFGLWEETGRLNEAVARGAAEGLGFGLSVGREIADGAFPHGDLSLFAAGFRLRVPVTVHVGIGYDIVHEHPSCDGAAIGAASYRDFLVLAQSVSNLEGGVILNFGTQVMGPETFLKALAMARNVARQEGRQIRSFLSAVFDVRDVGPNYREAPPKSDPNYYFRCIKTNLARTVAGGGTSLYVRGEHRRTVPALHHALMARLEGGSDR